jgi:metallophosphoesterase (TIGR00282 family)
MEYCPQIPAPQGTRIVFVGDTVGKPGVKIACLAAPWFINELQADCLLVNAENAADGSGLRCSDYKNLTQAGYDGITLGDHIYKKKEVIDLLDHSDNIVRPCNLPADAAGKPHMLIRGRSGNTVAVISALGRVFMKPVDCPFTAVARQLGHIPPDVVIRIVDFHAEATSDKQLMGRYLDGRVSAVLGTHTHVTTADEQIYPAGTGFQCDIGMTGPFESIIGRSIEAVITSTLTSMPLPFHIAKADIRLSATWLDVSPEDGKCQAIGRLALRQKFLEDYQRSRATLG